MGINTEWKNDLIVIGIVLIFLVITVIIPKLLKEKDIISKYAARKIIHSLAGLSVFSTPYLYHPYLALIISILMTFLTRKSSSNSNFKSLKQLFDAISEEEEIKFGYLQGPFAYSMAITIIVMIFLFFPDKYYFAISVIMIMMYADTFAAIIGRKYGKHHINIPLVGNKRTLEGSLAFFITALICSLSSFHLIINTITIYTSNLTSNEIFIFSLLISTISTLLELLSPSKYDDLIVPLGSIIFLIPMAIGLGLW